LQRPARCSLAVAVVVVVVVVVVVGAEEAAEAAAVPEGVELAQPVAAMHPPDTAVRDMVQGTAQVA
jgi:hypothetical protein